MRTKLDEKEKAVALRKQGWAVRKIAAELAVSRGSVSLWVRDVELTREQKEQLSPKSPHRMGMYCALASRKKLEAENIRRRYQDEGRALVTDVDLYMAGCMLYWGEGSKARTVMIFTNSDPDMVKFFMRFLREACHIDDGRIKLRVAAYLDNGLTQESIENYWLGVTRLSPLQLRKGTTKQCKDSRKHSLPYGTVAISVSSVEFLQRIYGSIARYAGFNSSKWL